MATQPIVTNNPTGIQGGFMNPLNPSGNTGIGTGMSPGGYGAPSSPGGPGNYGFGNSTNPGYIPAAPLVSPNAGSSSGTVGTSAPSTATGENSQTITTNNPYGQTQEQENRTLGELQNYYGEGVGSLLDQYINSGGGYNSALTQQSIDAETNAMQQQAALGSNTLNSQLGAMGLSGNSSSTALANSQYQQGVTANENNIAAQQYYQMWNDSQNRELSMLGQVANVNATGTANQGNWMTDLASVLGLGEAGTSLFNATGNLPGVPW